VFEDETPIAWTAMPRHAPVLAADGSEIGTAESVLGDVNEDIFHGLVVRRHQDGERVEVPAVRVKKMTEHHVLTDLATAEVGALMPYDRS
jgi:hypothetical protein